ncbi:MAG: CatB-related O-acetyltransferase [Chloroflexota bacterium]
MRHLNKFLRQVKFVFTSRRSESLRSLRKNNNIGDNVDIGADVFLDGNVSLSKGVRIRSGVSIGQFTTIGDYSILVGPISVGRYCQFGPNVAIYGRNHNFSKLTTYNSRMLFSGRLKEMDKVLPITIEHDVWIGHGAIVLSGVKIGTGAIIGGGSVVTRDVESYSIAVGNPAREIKKRFDNEMINILLKWAWWQYSTNELEKWEELFRIDFHTDRDEAFRWISSIVTGTEGN